MTTAVTTGPEAFPVGWSLDVESLSPELRNATLNRQAMSVDYEVPGLPEAAKQRSASIGTRVALWVPIVWRGQLLGMVGVDEPGERREFSEREVDLISAICTQAAAAVTNARLYETEHVIAETLQEALLTPPEPIAELEIAYRYLPASTEANVGGDFYDVFQIDAEHVGILIGDVSGKGLEAARHTALLRSGARAYALEDSEPVNVLTSLNALVYRSTPPEAFATVFFGVLNRFTGRLRYCGAGHPPGLIRCEGDTKVLKSRSAIVGAFPGAGFVIDEVTLATGDTLVLFTDGVFEARRGREMFGEDRAIEAVSRIDVGSIAGAPQQLIDCVLDFSGGEMRDDVVILCIRRSGFTGDSTGI